MELKNYTSRLIYFLLIITASTYQPLFSQGMSEEDLEEAIFSGDGDISDQSLVPVWSFYGYVENENFIAVDPDADPFVKFETRLRLNAKYGTEDTFLFLSGDLFFYPFHPGVQAASEAKVVEPYEAYLSVGSKLQFRAGLQVFNWGVADGFRVVNYLDRRDLREMFLKEEDERYRGLFAVSLKYITGDFSVEGVVAPLHQTAMLPDQGGFWSMDLPSSGGIQPTLHDYVLPPAYRNVSAALRTGGTFGAVDLHASYYHGPNRSLSFYPEITLLAPAMLPVKIDLYPLYEISNYVGFDIAAVFGRFSFRGELSWSPDQPAVHSDANDTVIVSQALPNIVVQRKTARASVLYYDAGIDFTYRATGRFWVEFSSSSYLKDSSLYEKEFFSDFFMIAWEDKFFREQLKIRLNTLIRPEGAIPGLAPGGSVTWDMRNGFEISVGTFLIYENDDTMLAQLAGKDLVTFKMKYTF